MFYVFHVRKKELTDKNKRVDRAGKTSPALYEREKEKERERKKKRRGTPRKSLTTKKDI